MNKEHIDLKHIETLKNIGIDGIEPKDLYLMKYKRGEFICLDGDTIEYIYIFIKGRAKVFFTSPNGKTLLMAYYAVSGIIGDLELMSDYTEASLSIQVITDVECIGIPFNRFKGYLKNNIVFMNYVGKSLAQKLRNNTINNSFNVLHSLEARLCRHIYMTNDNGTFKEKLTELSEIMGVSYRHLLRTLDKLCQEGVLEKYKKEYKIVDTRELQQRIED